MPADVVQKINAAVSEVVNDPVVRKRLVDEGAEIRLMTPAEFAAFMRQENARWVKVVKDAGITPQ
jgi:tripartite-type tricarboxylate transporter receptor subunit TctC